MTDEVRELVCSVKTPPAYPRGVMRPQAVWARRCLEVAQTTALKYNYANGAPGDPEIFSAEDILEAALVLAKEYEK